MKLFINNSIGNPTKGTGNYQDNITIVLYFNAAKLRQDKKKYFEMLALLYKQAFCTNFNKQSDHSIEAETYFF